MQIGVPYRVDARGLTSTVDEDAHVRNLIEQLLFTQPGERVMRPSFGSGLSQLVFQPSSAELATAVQFLVQGGLQQWLGDLITAEDVAVTADESTIEVRVQYTVRRTQQRRVAEFSRAV